MSQAKPNYIMIWTRRFEALRASLDGHLTIVRSDPRTAVAHVWKQRGVAFTLGLMFRRPGPEHYAQTKGNVLRKAARFPSMRDWSKTLSFYHFKKAKIAQFEEILISDAMADLSDPIALVYNGFNAPQSVLAHVARGGQTIYIENGYFAGTIQADPAGINANNTLPRSAAFYRSYQPKGEAPSLALNTRVPKHDADQTQVLPDRFVFVPFQVDSDSQITLQSPWIRDMTHLHSVVFDLLERLPDLSVVIKEHPYSRRVLKDIVPKHPRILFQNGRNTEELINRAEAVLTVNSTVGIEALSRGKPVITLGTACYNIPDLVSHAPDFEALVRVLDAPLAFDRDLTSRFLRYLRDEFLTPEAGHRPGETVHERLAEVCARAVPANPDPQARDSYAPPVAERTPARQLTSSS